MRVRTWATLLVAVTLAGCAAQRTFGEANALLADGRVVDGLAKLEEAVRLDPRNGEYRMALATRRAAVVNNHLAAGEAARREGRLDEAERAFREAQRFDPSHAMARQGLAAVALERKHRVAIGEAEQALAKAGAVGTSEAMERVRAVLTENPNHRDAQALRQRIQDALAKQQRPEAKLAAAYRKPITLEFRDAPLRSVFDLIARISGLNFFFDKDVRADLRATIQARNTSIEDAVRLLLVTNQLEQKVLNENSVLVYPNTPQKQKDYQTLHVRSFFLANADAKAVANAIKTIVKTRDMVVDERLGLIIVRDTQEAIRVAERLVALQDMSDPEVMLEVEVLEVKRSRLMELGVRWPASLSLSPLTGASGSLTLEALRNLDSSTLQASIGGLAVNANQQQQSANTLANPRIRVRNKEKAKVLIGDRVPIISTTSTSTGFVSESVSYVDVGLKLDVEPSVHLDEEVAIKISLEVSSLGAQTVSKAGTITYQIGTRGASTVLRLRDGETQILAGLINDEDRSSANRVPGIGELPILGRLFGSQNDDRQRSEILLSITPRVLRSIRRPDVQLAEFESGTETSIGSEGLRVAVAEPASPGGTAGAAASSGVSTRPAASVGPTSRAGAVAGSVQVAMSWQAPLGTKVGEVFEVALRGVTAVDLQELPLVISFDPQVMQLVDVKEGDIFRADGLPAALRRQGSADAGRLALAIGRREPNAMPLPAGTTGSLVMLSFRALAERSETRLRADTAAGAASGGAAPAGFEAVIRIGR